MSQQEPIILAKTGNPFTSEKAAQAHFKNNELNEDVWGVTKYKGGWAIAKHRWIAEQREREAVEAREAQAKRAAAEDKEEFFKVEFYEKSHPNDLPYVPLSKNGRQLRFPRGRETICPKTFLQIADDASHPQWEPSDEPDQPMKRAGTVRRYGYRVLGPATREDFDKLLAEGNAITQREVERLQNANA